MKGGASSKGDEGRCALWSQVEKADKVEAAVVWNAS